MRIRIRWQEISLKGGNRSFFVDRLGKSLRFATRDLPRVQVKQIDGRVFVEAEEASWPRLRERLSMVFGVANFARTRHVQPDPEALRRAVLEEVVPGSFESFRVSAKRADKTYPQDSMQIERELGAAVKAATGARVDLVHPELVIHVEVARKSILLSAERLAGPGGFPVGTAGKVLALLSGGIDSPVAAWRMMRRGCTVALVNFHSFPLQDRTMQDKVKDLARVLARWQNRTRLLLVPFAPVQQAIVAHCPAPLRVVLYRRFMVRIADVLRPRLRAKALVTGDSLGQVASQTLDNLRAVDDVARGTLLRPLVGMDKDEITREARKVGSYEISTLPDQDCCQLYVPRSPSLSAGLAELRRAESGLDLDGLVWTAARAAEDLVYSFPPEAVEVRRAAVPA